MRSGVGSRKMSLQHRTRKSNPFIELYLLLRLSVLVRGALLEAPYKTLPGVAPGYDPIRRCPAVCRTLKSPDRTSSFFYFHYCSPAEFQAATCQNRCTFKIASLD